MNKKFKTYTDLSEIKELINNLNSIDSDILILKHLHTCAIDILQKENNTVNVERLRHTINKEIKQCLNSTIIKNKIELFEKVKTLVSYNFPVSLLSCVLLKYFL